MQHDPRKTRVALLSVLSNTVLTLLKLVVGVSIGSVSVISEAIHSGMDLLAAVLAWLAVRGSSRAADRKYPFGYGKLENLSGTIEAFLILLAAVWIVYEAVQKLWHHAAVETPGWGVLVMAISAGANFLVSRQLFKVGRETDSVALLADGWHLRTDVWTSAGVMIGLALMWLGHWLIPGVALHWVDPLAALVVAALVAQTAWHLTIAAGHDLLDASLPDEEADWITDLLRGREEVRGAHHIHTRKAGAMRFVECHLVLDRNLTVQDSHRLTDQLTGEIRHRYPLCRVNIHVEPCNPPHCKESCLEGCKLTEAERTVASRAV